MDTTILAQTLSEFSFKFCNKIEGNKNTVCSPLSAEFVLAILALGSSGDAHHELLAAMAFPDDETITKSFSSLTKCMKSVSGVTLNVANKIYLKDGYYDLMPQLKKQAEKVFDAALEKIDFSDGVEAASVINKWVEGRTNNRIKNLLNSGDLNSDTRMVLVNALYFKGTWQNKFDERFTKDKPFHVNSRTTVKIPMMTRSANFMYGDSEQLKAQLLEMPYKGNGASMLVILPNKVGGLSSVMKKLADGHDLTTDIGKMRSQKVVVTIPKFTIETEIDLNKLLPKIGVRKIFDSGDSGLTKLLDSDESLCVSKAVQKAFVEVNEEGSEAAAATGMVVMLRASWSEIFEADHPFLAVILVKRYPVFVTVLCSAPNTSSNVREEHRDNNTSSNKKCIFI